MLLGSTCAACREPGPTVCGSCTAELRLAGAVPPLAGIDGWSALLRYDDVARSLVVSLKNGQRRDLVAWFADRVAATVSVPPHSVVTWAPTGRSRRLARGFDQAELLARALARRWRVPCRSLLERLPGPPQEGQARAARRVNPTFEARRACPDSVVVIDDVATTGATVGAAARALRHAGAREVRAVVLARAATSIAR